MNKKFSILYLSLLALPSCAPWRIRRHKAEMPVQKPLPKKAYLSIADIECEDCFSLIKGILSSIKGVHDVSLESKEYNVKTAGTSTNRVVISYDPAIELNKVLIKMMLEEWSFELEKIEL